MGLRVESTLRVTSLIRRLRHPDIDLDASGEEALGVKTVPPYSLQRDKGSHWIGEVKSMSAKKKRAAIDLSLEVENREEEDRSSGGDSDRRSKDVEVHKEEGHLKRHGEAPKEENSEEKVVEVVVDQEGKGSKEEIKYRTQSGEEMEEDKQLAEEADGNDESDGAETRAEDKHVVEDAGNSNHGGDNHNAMELDEVCITCI